MEALNKIIKYSLYLLVFLFPLWFLPLTTSPLVINKQMLLAAFAFLLLIFWMIKIIISGKVSLNWGKLPLTVFLLLIVIGICTFFSSAKIQSFWGMDFNPDTLFSFVLYILLFFLVSNLISGNQLSSAVISFLTGSGILSLLFLIQILKPIFPWDFTQSSSFNLIGSIQALGVFLGGAFLILITLITADKKLINADREIGINQPKSAIISGKATLKRLASILPIILGILLFISIFLINYWVVWLGIAFGALIIIFRMLKNISGVAPQGNPLKPLFLPVFIFVVALVLIFLKLPIGNIVNLSSEISPTFQATFDIGLKTLKEGTKNFILGSGPATFGYQYSLHRGIGPNLGDFWQIRFDQGTNVVLTLFATLGILGALAILLMIAIFFWQGFKTLIYTDEKRINTDKNETQLAAFVGGFYFLVLWFFYSSTAPLYFAVFLMMGLFAAASSKMKEFSFAQSPQKAFFIMLVCIVFIVGSILGIYGISQKYAAAIIYSQGLNLINAKTPELDEGIIKINKAATLDPKDSYFRNLSQAFLLKINEIINNQDLTQEQKQTEFQRQVSNAELSATAAVQINPKNSQNWLQLGNIYENFTLISVKGAEDLAVLNYQKAADLDPQNPLIPFSMARVYFASGKKEEAEKELEKSLQLKSDFQPAIDLLKQIETPESE